MKILRKLWVCCLCGCIFLCPNYCFANNLEKNTNSNVQSSDLQTQKKNAILKKLENADLILPEIKMLEKNDKEDVECLALNIYHEARGSTIEDRIASTYVVFNRFNDKHYPLTSKKQNKSLCDIIFDKWQFCWTNNKVIPIPKEKQAWIDSQKLAYELYSNPSHKELAKDFQLKHYVVSSLLYDKSRPKWIDTRKNSVKIGAHSYMSLINDNISQKDVDTIMKKSLKLILKKNIGGKISLKKSEKST